MLYPVISQLEIHRQSEYGTEPPDAKMHLLAQLPKDALLMALLPSESLFFAIPEMSPPISGAKN